MSESTDLPQSDDSENLEALSVDETPALTLPDDLPPVEPPSAGMIIQLFLIPAIIVAVIVGVYLLFGRLAAQEQDWRQLVVDVSSENPHLRWRGALGLAQLLDADAQRGEKSQNLAANTEIATALAELYSEFVDLDDLSEEELKNLEFLSKALGRMQTEPEIVPVFREGIQPDRDRNVRKHSMIGLAMLAGNILQAGNEIQNPELVDELIEISKENDQLFRHQGAFALGLIPTEQSKARLQVLLDDPDLMTSVNAAVGLARNGSTDGMTVFFGLLRDGAGWKLNPTQVKNEEQGAEYFERMLMLTNTLKAFTELKSSLTPDQLSELKESLQQLSESTQDNVLKSQIIELQATL